MNTRRRAGLAAATLTAALAVGGTAIASPSTGGATGSRQPVERLRFQGLLVDLAPTVAGPLDGATAVLGMRTDRAGGTTFRLMVRHVGEAARGQSFGAHLHLGPCVAGSPSAALGHYNTDVLAGITPVVASPTTEVWLDLTVDADGDGSAVAHVPFVPNAGDRSVVIHTESTNPATGTAGARLACLPVSW